MLSRFLYVNSMKISLNLIACVVPICNHMIHKGFTANVLKQIPSEFQFISLFDHYKCYYALTLFLFESLNKKKSNWCRCMLMTKRQLWVNNEAFQFKPFQYLIENVHEKPRFINTLSFTRSLWRNYTLYLLSWFQKNENNTLSSLMQTESCSDWNFSFHYSVKSKQHIPFILT